MPRSTRNLGSWRLKYIALRKFLGRSSTADPKSSFLPELYFRQTQKKSIFSVWVFMDFQIEFLGTQCTDLDVQGHF